MCNSCVDEEVDDDDDYEDDDDYGLQEEGDDDGDNCHDDEDGMDDDSEYIEEEGDIEVYNNQYRGTYIDYMTDEDEDDGQDAKAEKCYYLKSDRTISDLAFEETNSYINQYNLQLPVQLA